MVNPPQHPTCRCDMVDPDQELGEIVGYRTFTDIWAGRFVRKKIPIRKPVEG